MSLLEKTLKFANITGGILPVKPGEEKEEKGKKSSIVVWGLGLTSVALAGCASVINPINNEVLTQTPTPQTALKTQSPPTPTPEPTPTSIPTETPTPTPNPAEVIFSNNQPFFEVLNKLDKQAGEHFRVEGDKAYLFLAGEKVEIDPTTAAINVDINGNPLSIEPTAYEKILTVHGKKGTESEGKIFAFNPPIEYTVMDPNTGDIKQIRTEGHWFEVIVTNHPVDTKAPEAVQKKQLLEAINDPIPLTLEQIQNGDWNLSVILSGYLQPFEFTPKDLEDESYHIVSQIEKNHPQFGEIYFFFSQKENFRVPMFGRIEVNNGEEKVGIYIRPFMVCNTDTRLTEEGVPREPDPKEIAILNLAIEEIDPIHKERQKTINNSWLRMFYLPINKPNQPQIWPAIWFVTYNPNGEIFNKGPQHRMLFQTPRLEKALERLPNSIYTKEKYLPGFLAFDRRFALNPNITYPIAGIMPIPIDPGTQLFLFPMFPYSY